MSRRRSRQSGARLSGEIVEIVERANRQYVGTYVQEAGVGLVKIDGTEFAQPIVVGDPGAKNVQVNDKVVVEMIRYPTAKRRGEGVVTEVLGRRGQPGVDTLMILRQFQLPERFPADVLEEARAQARDFEPEIGADRVDLTNLTVVTIDPEDARDFDDAISLQPLPNGHWRLGVHIADVSHFVPAGSALDQEARQRATSIYLPDRVIPMLPEIISNHLASLQPEQIRYTKSAFIEFTADGARVATDFCTGAIRSCRRFTYEEVDDYLAAPNRWQARLTPEVIQLLNDMDRLAMTLRRRRSERGSIELLLPELKILLDREGKVVGARRIEHTESHQIIEEFMLAANEAVAERLRDEKLVFLRRIHESPDPRKLEILGEFVRELGIACDRLENRFEIQRVLAQVAGQPLQQAVNFAVLRAMQKAVYSPAEEGHYALATRDYCHFTSPIRRYPDLTIHRLMEAVFRRQHPPQELDRLLSLGEHCSQQEQRAEAAERELVKLKLLNFLVQKIGQTMDAVITGVEDFGLFAQGIELPAEGLIHIDTLRDDHYRFDANTHALVGHRAGNTFRLGDVLQVRIANVDLDRRELDFEVLKRIAPQDTARRSQKSIWDDPTRAPSGSTTRRRNLKSARKKAKKKTPRRRPGR
jgi:ribonuclease R